MFAASSLVKKKKKKNVPDYPAFSLRVSKKKNCIHLYNACYKPELMFKQRWISVRYYFFLSAE